MNVTSRWKTSRALEMTRGVTTKGFRRSFYFLRSHLLWNIFGYGPSASKLLFDIIAKYFDCFVNQNILQWAKKSYFTATENILSFSEITQHSILLLHWSWEYSQLQWNNNTLNWGWTVSNTSFRKMAGKWLLFDDWWWLVVGPAWISVDTKCTKL